MLSLFVVMGFSTCQVARFYLQMSHTSFSGRCFLGLIFSFFSLHILNQVSFHLPCACNSLIGRKVLVVGHLLAGTKAWPFCCRLIPSPYKTKTKISYRKTTMTNRNSSNFCFNIRNSWRLWHAQFVSKTSKFSDRWNATIEVTSITNPTSARYVANGSHWTSTW